MPGEPRQWDLDAIDQWRAARQSQMDRTGKLTPDGRAADDAGELSERQQEILDAKSRAALADARKKDADARIKEIQARKAENLDLVELSEVEEFLTGFLAETRNIILAVPVKLKRFGQDVADASSQELNLALHAIRKKMERLVEIRSDG